MATSGMDENLLRELAPQVLAAVLHRYNDFAFAEDAVQEALVAAMMQWPKEGTPKQPLAWLIRVASRRMLDHYRSETARRRREQAADRAEATDWPQILALYRLLDRMTDNPFVSLNMVVAAAKVHGPEAGFARLETLAGNRQLAGHYRLDAVRAFLHELGGDLTSAIACYRSALEKTSSLPERQALAKKSRGPEGQTKVKRAAIRCLSAGLD